MDDNRRKFLKIMLIGGGTFLVGKLLEPLISKFSDTVPDAAPEPSGKTFAVSDDKEKLSVYDETGEEVLQIDKSS